MSVKRGLELELEIESLAFGGAGVSRVDGFVVFVDGAIPGQRVLARITRKRKAYAEARTLQLLQESPQAVTPECPHFGECGGCRFQNLHYDRQLEIKRRQVEESLARIGHLQATTVLPTIPSPGKFYYRNKMEFSFGRQRWLSREEIEADDIARPRNFALGMHVRGRYDKILDLDTCFLQSPVSPEILNFVKKYAYESGIPAYSTSDHQGFWRHLVVRDAKRTQQVMVNIVTADQPDHFPVLDRLVSSLTQAIPAVTTCVHNINRKKSQVATGDSERVLYGPGVLTEKIGHCAFQISANSFFQTNTEGAEVLYDKVVELGQFSPNDRVVDLYSGAGTISLYLASRVKEVVGFELIDEAVRDAEKNRELNGIDNCRFVSGDVKETFSDSKSLDAVPDIVIIDPPRAGMHPDVIATLLRLVPQRMVYVSCNPTTFARDVALLCDEGYTLDVVQPIDMFPHTPHIELVSVLHRRV